MSTESLNFNVFTNLSATLQEALAGTGTSEFILNPTAIAQLNGTLLGGTGDDKANQIFMDTRLMLPSTTLNYDLAAFSGNLDPLGNSYNITKVKHVFIQVLGDLGTSKLGTAALARVDLDALGGVSGYGYTVSDSLTAVGGTGSGAKFTVSVLTGTAVNTVVVAVPGTNYIVGDVVTVTGGTGSFATFLITAVTTGGAVTSAMPVAAGSGYMVNDVLTVFGGTGTAATLIVTAVGGGGAITGLAINTIGSYATQPPSSGAKNMPSTTHGITSTGAGYTAGDSLTVAAGTRGNGTGGSSAVLHVSTVSSGAITACTITTPGSFYAVGDCIWTTGGTGYGATFQVTGVSSGGITSVEPAGGVVVDLSLFTTVQGSQVYTEADTLLIGNAASNIWTNAPWFSAANDAQLRIKSGTLANPGTAMFHCGGNTAWAVVAASNNVVKFSTASNTNPLAFLFVIVGSTL